MTNGIEACLQELELLKSIDASLKVLAQPITSFQEIIDGWTVTRTGKSLFYKKTITYTGSAESHDIVFPRPVQLNRIEQVWNDGIAKDFSVRIFMDPDTIYYAELDAQTTNTALNRIIQLGTEYKYPGDARLRMYYVNTTAGKICTVRVQGDEL